MSFAPERTDSWMLRTPLSWTSIFKSPVYAFQAWGWIGFASAVFLSSWLAAARGLYVPAVVFAAVVAALAFLLTALGRKVLTGEERLIFFQEALAVFCAAAILLYCLRLSIPLYLDVTALGVGTFLVFGRIGCFTVGCCHGRPARHGVRYRTEHSEAGFPSHFVGVRLFPVQIVESVFVACVVSAGAILFLRQSPPGGVFSFYIVAYSFGRFWMELARGDSGRPYLGSFSEAQWTSLLLSISVACAERFKVLPWSRWHWTIPLSIAVAMLLLGIHRRFDRAQRFELMHPLHVRELAEILQRMDAPVYSGKGFSKSKDPFQRIELHGTTSGLLISSARFSVSGPRTLHFSVSRQPRPLELRQVRRLAILISRLLCMGATIDVTPGASGVFHILFAISKENTRRVFQETRASGLTAASGVPTRRIGRV